MREVTDDDEAEEGEQILVVAVDALAFLDRRRAMAVHDRGFGNERDCSARLDHALAERDVLAESSPAEAVSFPARATHRARDVVERGEAQSLHRVELSPRRAGRQALLQIERRRFARSIEALDIAVAFAAVADQRAQGMQRQCAEHQRDPGQQRRGSH